MSMVFPYYYTSSLDNHTRFRCITNESIDWNSQRQIRHLATKAAKHLHNDLRRTKDDYDEEDFPETLRIYEEVNGHEYHEVGVEISVNVSFEIIQ